jgi:hypothetical protein
MTVTAAQRSAYTHAFIGILASSVLAGLTAVGETAAGQFNWSIVLTVFLCVFLATLVHVGLAYETQQIAALPATNPNKSQDTDILTKLNAIADIFEVIGRNFLPPAIRSTLSSVEAAPLVHIYTGNSAPTITTTKTATTNDGMVTTSTETATPAPSITEPPTLGSSISDETTQTIATQDVNAALANDGKSLTTVPLNEDDTQHRLVAMLAKKA